MRKAITVAPLLYADLPAVQSLSALPREGQYEDDGAKLAETFNLTVQAQVS